MADKMLLPDDDLDDNPDQRRERSRREREAFLERWQEHAETLEKERAKTIQQIIKDGSWSNLVLCGWRGYKQFPKDNREQQMAIWNGNPYACKVKKPWELYEELHPVTGNEKIKEKE